MLPTSDLPSGLRRALCAAAVFAMAMPQPTFAANKDVTLEMRPHCVFGDLDPGFGGYVPDAKGITTPTEGKCYSFETRDPRTRQTPVLKKGETLDIDIIARNPGRQDISRFRSWLAYDPTTLEGQEIEIDDAFPLETPGESGFDESEGYAKIGASAEEDQDDETVVLARVRFTVIDVSEAQTVITFYDAESAADAHTMAGAGEPEENVLALPLGSLLVRLDGGSSGSDDTEDDAGDDDETDEGDADNDDDGAHAAGDDGMTPVPPSPPVTPPQESSVGAASSAPASQAASSTAPIAPPPSGTSLFPQLQVQNLRATTEGTSIYLAWDALTSTELAGYNVYYGTVSGQYIQRRSVDKGSNTLTLRNLQAGRAYYIAVRGVSTSGAESEFSKEVGITVGNPATSTNPLASIVDQGPQGTPPETDGTLAGETGLPSPLVLLLAVSAVIGTVMAFRRQMTAFTPHA